MADLDSIAAEAAKIGIDRTSEEVAKWLELQEQKINKSAKEFYDLYVKTEKIINSQSFKTTKKRNRSFEIKAFQDGTRRAFDKFQNDVNEYFNQLVKIMYVYMSPETGEVTLYAMDNNVENLELHKKYKDPRYILNTMKKEIFVDETYDATLLNNTEQSIYQRWQIAKSKIKKSQYLPILWYIGEWRGAFLSNLGTVAEAYVNFYLCKFKFLGDLEIDVETYILGGCGAVDNASGFLIGDVSSALPNGRSVQWAVKKENAAPMKMKKIKEYLDDLIGPNGEFNLNMEELKKRFIEQETKEASHGQMRKMLRSELEITKDKVVGEYFNQKIISTNYNILKE